MIKNNPSIKDLNIFNNTQYFFKWSNITLLTNEKFYFRLFNSHKKRKETVVSFLVTGYSQNIPKFEITGIGSLKEVKIAIYGIKCIDWTAEARKISGVHFSCNWRL